MRKGSLAKYLRLTFVISWASWGMLILLIALGVTTFAEPMGFGLFLIGGFGPTIAALSLQERGSLARFIFGGRHRGAPYFLLFCALLGGTIWIASDGMAPDAMPTYLFPVFWLLMTVIGGGNEELGWRGVMQPLLEKKVPFPIAVAATSLTWSAWHIPLWFAEGSAQQQIPFLWFALSNLALSFVLAVLYKKTTSVFLCGLLHGLFNTMTAYFLLGFNWIMAAGGVAIIGISVVIWLMDHRGAKKCPSESLSRVNRYTYRGRTV